MLWNIHMISFKKKGDVKSSWLPYSTYLHLDFHLLSRRWQLHTGGSKMFKPLFHAGLSIFYHFFCRIYMTTDWRGVRSHKLIHRSGKHTEKQSFLKTFLKDSRNGPAQIGNSQNGPAQIGNSQNGPAQIGNSWNGPAHIKNSQNGQAQIRNLWALATTAHITP